MNRLLDIWRSWSVRRRAATVILATVTAAGLGVLAYDLLKRPGDLSDPNVDFSDRQTRQDKPKPKKPEDKTVDWPTYGLNDQRSRHFLSNKVKPPYRGSDWSFQAGKLLEFSPIIVDDRIYFMDIDARFFALNAKRGKVSWKRRIGKLNASSPSYANGRLFAVTLNPGQAVALRPRDGKVLWRKSLPGRSESSPLTFKDNLVIFGCECGTVFALDQKDGSVEWTVDTAGPVKGALAQGKGNVYGGNYAGEFFSIDAKTGKQEWKISTSGGSFGRGGGVYSTPTIAHGRVYFGSLDSRIYSVDLDDGRIAWSKSTGAEVYSGPAVAETKHTPPTVYIGSADNVFYALDAKSGAVRWQKDVGGQVTGAATVIGNVVYVSVIGDDRGTIGFDIRSGKKVFEHELGEYNPAITDGERLYLTGYSTLRAFTHDDGKPRGKKGGKPRGERTAGGGQRAKAKRARQGGKRSR